MFYFLYSIVPIQSFYFAWLRLLFSVIQWIASLFPVQPANNVNTCARVWTIFQSSQLPHGVPHRGAHSCENNEPSSTKRTVRADGLTKWVGAWRPAKRALLANPRLRERCEVTTHAGKREEVAAACLHSIKGEQKTPFAPRRSARSANSGHLLSSTELCMSSKGLAKIFCNFRTQPRS